MKPGDLVRISDAIIEPAWKGNIGLIVAIADTTVFFNAFGVLIGGSVIYLSRESLFLVDDEPR